MRVLIVNTSEKTGGAALAANRLMTALNDNGIKARMLVRDKETDNVNVIGLKSSWLQMWHFLWERWCVFLHLHLSRQHLFDIDIANTGNDITSLDIFNEADIIHLSWVNQGMLSLADIRKILRSGKPVVWTMHDIWPATAICHLTLDCQRFTDHCRYCPYLPKGGSIRDLSYRIWQRKAAVYARGNLTFVGCSEWLSAQARQSALLAEHNVVSIPNPIDTRIFRSYDKTAARRRLGLPEDAAVKLVLFVAQRITNVNKGMQYLIDACHMLTQRDDDFAKRTAIVILGGHADAFEQAFDLPVYALGYTSDTRKIVDIYNAVDAFVLPSLSENLPNTIMEAMACGVPCIGFRVGGIPEMIDHRNTGYVARFRDAEDLAEGIRWVLMQSDTESLAQASRRKVAQQYSQSAVATRYIEVYNEALRRNPSRL